MMPDFNKSLDKMGGEGKCRSRLAQGFFGIYDGHCGSEAAQFVRDRLHDMIGQHGSFVQVKLLFLLFFACRACSSVLSMLYCVIARSCARTSPFRLYFVCLSRLVFATAVLLLVGWVCLFVHSCCVVLFSRGGGSRQCVLTHVSVTWTP